MTGKKKGSSETIRAVCAEEISNLNTLSKNRYNRKNGQNFFHYWLAGLIDADGSLLLSKAGYTSCEITVGIKEIDLLLLVKKKLGGEIKKRSKVQAYRWRLHNKTGMTTLVSLISNKLHREARIAQSEKVLKQLSLQPPKRCPFSVDNAWLAGFFEGEGYFRVNPTNLQLSITLSQKDKRLLKEIAKEMGGRIFYDRSWDGWLYAALSPDHIARWILYFSRYPLISWKQVQLIRFKRILLYKSRKIHLEREGKPFLRFQRLVSTFHSGE